MINLGCNHLKYAYNHCAEMSCRNYKNKCPLHATTGSSTATCNLERAKSLVSLEDDTRETIDKAIGLCPALEETILLIADLAFRDGGESTSDTIEEFMTLCPAAKHYVIKTERPLPCPFCA